MVEASSAAVPLRNLEGDRVSDFTLSLRQGGQGDENPRRMVEGGGNVSYPVQAVSIHRGGVNNSVYKSPEASANVHTVNLTTTTTSITSLLIKVFATGR